MDAQAWFSTGTVSSTLARGQCLGLTSDSQGGFPWGLYLCTEHRCPQSKSCSVGCEWGAFEYMHYCWISIHAAMVTDPDRNTLRKKGLTLALFWCSMLWQGVQNRSGKYLLTSYAWSGDRHEHKLVLWSPSFSISPDPLTTFKMGLSSSLGIMWQSSQAFPKAHLLGDFRFC